MRSVELCLDPVKILNDLASYTGPLSIGPRATQRPDSDLISGLSPVHVVLEIIKTERTRWKPWKQ